MKNKVSILEAQNMNNNQKYDKEIADLKEQLASSADELTVCFLMRMM